MASTSSPVGPAAAVSPAPGASPTSLLAPGASLTNPVAPEATPVNPVALGAGTANPVTPGTNPGEASAAPVHHNIAVDDEMDSDGNYESSHGTDTTSLSSGVFDYQYENGRRYHAYREGRYVMPNDEKEQDRLDMTHHMYLILLDGRLVVPPVENPQNILDVGTGTGIWAIDVADLFPSAVVVGTDLSPIQPGWVPPNCKFQVDDAESDWTFPRNHFDLVHSRHLMTSIRDWPRYIEQIYESITPGGWLQMAEHDFTLSCDDGSLGPDNILRTWFELYHQATEKLNLPPIAHKLPGMLSDAGFAEVIPTTYHLPWGPWAKDKKLKEIGAWMLANSETSFEAYGLAFLTRILGKSHEEAQDLCDKAHKELRSKKIHVYNKHWMIIARKPFDT